ncbi:MAG: preprotein translocase subunit SecE [Oscillospiraceae bacterium]|nr:preprotein translocase subunit SecE [Oscillospiraceae bacterium]
MAEANKKENFFVRAFKRVKKWFREMKSELKKVVWPTKKQVLHNVLITLVCCAVVGLCIWVLDLASSFVVEGIISLVKG